VSSLQPFPVLLENEIVATDAAETKTNKNSTGGGEGNLPRTASEPQFTYLRAMVINRFGTQSLFVLFFDRFQKRSFRFRRKGFLHMQVR